MPTKLSNLSTNPRVLGIDPGFDRVGLAILEKDEGKEKLIYSNCIVTDRKHSHHKRLYHIGQEIRVVIKKWKPNNLAIESLFFNQNTTTAIKVAEARGVMLYEASQAGLEIYEYGPQTIKIAVTGYGKANKEQVTTMVGKLVKIPESKGRKLDDELDAIALCITHLASQKGI
jgi:crossover junction endodeoxyribonuclease RuvC